MLREFRSLINALGRATKAPPQDLLEAIGTLPPVGALPSPSTAWLYLTLMAWRKRQQWGRQLLGKHMPNAIPPCKAFREQDQPFEMVVPGAPEWDVSLECDYHFAQLTNRVTEEFLIVGTTRVDRESIIYVESLDRCVGPTWRSEPLGRLVDLHPDFATIRYAIDDMIAAKALRAVFDDRRPCPPGTHPDGYLLTVRATDHADVVEGFLRHWKNVGARLWLSAQIGDWLLAHELAAASGDAQLIAATRRRADRVLKLRHQTPV